MGQGGEGMQIAPSGENDGNGIRGGMEAYNAFLRYYGSAEILFKKIS